MLEHCKESVSHVQSKTPPKATEKFKFLFQILIFLLWGPDVEQNCHANIPPLTVVEWTTCRVSEQVSQSPM
jgi:hypothetical protein